MKPHAFSVPSERTCLLLERGKRLQVPQGGELSPLTACKRGHCVSKGLWELCLVDAHDQAPLNKLFFRGNFKGSKFGLKFGSRGFGSSERLPM